MSLKLYYLVFFIQVVGAYSSNERDGPCPGLPIDSCECFQILHDRSLKISSMTDIVARNWEISLMYQDISHSFQKLLRTAPGSATNYPAIGIWPSVAAWACNTVGFDIRQQGISELWAYLMEKLPHWMQKIIKDTPAKILNILLKEILRNASIALGQGNLIVFQQISSVYVYYGMEFCGNVTLPDDTKMTKFIQKYLCTDGQCNLAKSLWSLYQAHSGASQSMSFSDRDQLLLIQSLYSGLEEQTRLQPYVNASLPGYMIQWCRYFPMLDDTKCREFLNKVGTAVLVHLFIGKYRLSTDEDVPSGLHNGANFSPFLTNLTNTDAHDLMVKMLNRTTLDLENTTAPDWNIFDQRMKFISAVFWVFQDHEDLNCYLYSAEQEHLIRTNQTEKLDPYSWLTICDNDCCAANGRWDGIN